MPFFSHSKRTREKLAREDAVHAYLAFTDGERLGIVYSGSRKNACITLPLYSFFARENPRMSKWEHIKREITHEHQDLKPGRVIPFDYNELPSKSGGVNFYYVLIPVKTIVRGKVPKKVYDRKFRYISIDDALKDKNCSKHVLNVCSRL